MALPLTFLKRGRRLSPSGFITVICLVSWGTIPQQLIQYHKIIEHSTNISRRGLVFRSMKYTGIVGFEVLTVVLRRVLSSLLATCFMLVYCLAYSSTLKMEVTCPFETSVDFKRTARSYISEDRTFHETFCLKLWTLFECGLQDRDIIDSGIWVPMFWRNTPSIFMAVYSSGALVHTYKLTRCHNRENHNMNAVLSFGIVFANFRTVAIALTQKWHKFYSYMKCLDNVGWI
jgi:hypothetical protein